MQKAAAERQAMEAQQAALVQKAADAKRQAAEVAAAHKRAESPKAQGERSAGLRVGGFPAGKDPKLRGPFGRDAAAPEANGRLHWSTAEGGHLYYSIQDKWLLNATGFTPNKTNATVTFATAGEVPVGEAVWRYVDMSLKDTDGTMGKFVDRMLTVTEL